MNVKVVILGALALSSLLVGCDDKASAPAAAASASASAASAPTPPPSASAAPPPSAAPSATTASAPGAADSKDVVVTVKDPTAEPEKTVKAPLGGTVTLYLPDFPGTVWSVDSNDKSFGKGKEEIIPGFAPGTNGHQFQWSTKNPLLSVGSSHVVKLVNKKAGKPNGTFTFTVQIS